MMKSKQILAAMLALFLVMLAGCGTASSSSSAPQSSAPSSSAPAASSEAEPTVETRVFRLADNHPDGYPTVLGDLRFSELVNERTNGAIQIDVYNNGVLGDETTTVEQVQFGAIDFIRVGTNLLSSVNPDLNALSLPYLYRDRDHMFKVLDGEIGQDFMTRMYDNGLLGLCWFDSGARNFYNSKREISTPADMVGLKIRVQESNLMMTLVSSLGGSPTPMAYAEIYSGIQNGVIDGAENNWPSYMTQSHNEVAPYFTVDGHTRAPEMILVSTKVWESLSEEEQGIVKQAALESAEYQREEWVRQEKEYEDAAAASGSTITRLTPEQAQLFADAVAPVYELPEYAGFADIVQRIRDIQ